MRFITVHSKHLQKESRKENSGIIDSIVLMNRPYSDKELIKKEFINDSDKVIEYHNFPYYRFY